MSRFRNVHPKARASLPCGSPPPVLPPRALPSLDCLLIDSGCQERRRVGQSALRPLASRGRWSGSGTCFAVRTTRQGGDTRSGSKRRCTMGSKRRLWPGDEEKRKKREEGKNVYGTHPGMWAPCHIINRLQNRRGTKNKRIR